MDGQRLTPAVALGRVIAARRALLGFKRKDLVAASTLSYPYVSEIEAGHKEPTLASLRLLARVLDTTPSTLLDHAERLVDDDDIEHCQHCGGPNH